MSERDTARIAEAAAQAWQTSYLGDQLYVPLGTVAGVALAVAAGPAQSVPLLAALDAGDAEEFGEQLYEVWGRMWIARPDLIARTAPLWQWLREGAQPEQLTAARRVTALAMRAGLDRLMNDQEARRDSDLLGHLLMELRPAVARTGRGQFYTPRDVGEVLAHLNGLTGIRPGQSVVEPACGTGSLLGAAAQVMRQHGTDPATVRWFAVDIDEAAIGCLAVNVVLWDLGHQVQLGCGDILKSPDEWLQRAAAERAHGLGRMQLAETLGLVHLLNAATARRDGDRTDVGVLERGCDRQSGAAA